MSLADGLVLGWKFEEPGGNYAPRVNRTAIDGVLVDINSIHSVAGLFGFGIGTATGQRAAYSGITNNAGIGIPTGKYTVAQWVKPASLTGGTDLIHRFGSQGTGQNAAALGRGALTSLQGSVGAERVVFQQQLSGGTTAFHFVRIECPGVLFDGNYHLIIWTYDKDGANQFPGTAGLNLATGRLALHLDGSDGTPTDPTYPLVGIATAASTAGPAIDELYGSIIVGATNNGTNFYTGNSDELFVWNRVLTNAEITTLYNLGSGLSLPDAGFAFNPRRGNRKKALKGTASKPSISAMASKLSEMGF